MTAWLQAHVDPWWTVGHTVLLVDHVPKQKKDRPRGGIGSQAKLARIDGAALYAHGVPWNGQEGGHVHLTVHKDRPRAVTRHIERYRGNRDGGMERSNPGLEHRTYHPSRLTPRT